MQKSASVEYLYGLNPIFESLLAGRRRIHGAFVNPQATGARMEKLRRLLEERRVPVEPADKGRLAQLCGSREHQNVVVRTGRYPYERWADILRGERVLLLDNVEDPHNVGAILRTAEVLGFHDILLPTKGVPEIYPSVAKVSAGAVEYLRIARDGSANKYVQRAQEAGFTVAALDARGKTALDSFRPESPLLLVIGGEDKAVRQYILNAADAVLAIPQHGRINSLNASVAASLALYALGKGGDGGGV